MNSLATPTQAIQSVQHPISEPISNMIYTTSSSIVPGLIGTSNTVSIVKRKEKNDFVESKYFFI